MVVARHLGRLGNNMFQIAAAIGYARKFGYEWAADSSSGYGEPYSSIHTVFPNLPKSQPQGHRYHEHPHGICPLHNVSFDVCHFNYHPIADLYGPNISLSGFFQSYKYFENSQEEIKKVFNLPHWVEYEDYVSIHVRRGDYVQHQGSFPPITVEYVHQSMAALKRAIVMNEFEQKVIVFSDDISWCKENLFQGWEYSQGRTERQDLEIMASCKHHIIANSTFSWWAAYLGHNPHRTVISPSYLTPNWFGPTGGVKDPIDLLPPDWIQIRFR